MHKFLKKIRKNKNKKIFPKSFLKIRKKCCICLSDKFRTKQCSICSEGIICLSCHKKLSTEQLNKCPVCRMKSDSFIINIKDINNSINNNVMDNRRCFSFEKYFKYLEFLTCNCLVFTIFFLGLSYLFGLLFFAVFFNVLKLEKEDHIIAFIIGIIILICICKCFHCSVASCDI